MEKIRPFKFINPNQCPKCFGILRLEEKETYKAKLNSEGIPMDGDIYVEAKLICTKCKEEFDCEKRGMSYIIDDHLPPIKPVYKTYNPFYK